MAYQPRAYRSYTESSDLISFNVAVLETDIFISADKDMRKQAEKSVLSLRREICGYIEKHPEFAVSFKPLGCGRKAPAVIKEMAAAAKDCEVGPMAAVAGAIAEKVGSELLRFSSQVIVENGGDIFIASKVPRVVGVYAGMSRFNERLGIRIEPRYTPCGICTSSGTVGHSTSLGSADAVAVLSASTALADACATSLCNMVKDKGDIKKAISRGKKIKGIRGVMVIADDTLGVWGDMKLVDI